MIFLTHRGVIRLGASENMGGLSILSPSPIQPIIYLSNKYQVTTLYTHCSIVVEEKCKKMSASSNGKDDKRLELFCSFIFWVKVSFSFNALS